MRSHYSTFHAWLAVSRSRIQALGEIIHQIADQVTLVGLYYNPVAAAAADRLLNVSSGWPGLFITSNAHEWDVRS